MPFNWSSCLFLLLWLWCIIWNQVWWCHWQHFFLSFLLMTVSLFLVFCSSVYILRFFKNLLFLWSMTLRIWLELHWMCRFLLKRCPFSQYSSSSWGGSLPTLKCLFYFFSILSFKCEIIKMAHGWAKVLVIKPDMSLILASHIVEGENSGELILLGCPLTSTCML